MNIVTFNRFIIAVNIIVVRDDGKILGLESFKRDGLLELPGGKLEPGETVEQAAYREVREETGLNVMLACGEAFLRVGSLERHKTDIIATVKGKPYPSTAYEPLQPTKEGVPVWVDPEAFMHGNFWDYNEEAFKFFGIDLHDKKDYWVI